MSDGPHKSLPMSRGWKKVAKFADNSAYEQEEVAEAFTGALETDWKNGVSKGLLNQVLDIVDSPSLINEVSVSAIEKLCRESSGNPVASTFLNYLMAECNSNGIANVNIPKVALNTLKDISSRHIRQMGEHYIRESNRPRSQKVVARLSDSIKGDGLKFLAGRMVSSKSQLKVSSPKKNGLDEGVRF